MKKIRLSALLLFAFSFCANTWAGSIEAIRQALEQSSQTQVQEKVYLHTDNSCYFVGDTLWFKGYVVRADNLTPTDMSRILYVELLSPDGLLIERQNIIISPNGHTCGQFVLKDSLYSGYYELRAYTRWMLNFNVRHNRYSLTDKRSFFNKQMAADYFRVWDGLYSRVFPVYSKPEEAGDYSVRRMYQRPKQRIQKPKKENLLVSFYPEGGHLIDGVPNQVAFEITDQNGEAVQLRGTVSASGMNPIEVHTEYMGRGSFAVVPNGHRLRATFRYHGKDYDFNLPKSESKGMALQLRGETVRLTPAALPADKEYGLSVLCRGSLVYFARIGAEGGAVHLPVADFPSGVNEITVFNDDGRILADRLFFVNHHEQDSAVITAPIEATHTYAPYEKIEMPIQCQGVTSPTVFSVSIRDTNTEEPSYNDGDIRTDLLLSSELRGFIAHPAYYFEKDDAQHRRHLDLLMMVQGWRKYKWLDLANENPSFRYTPERSLTVEGHVYKMLPIESVEQDEINSWLTGVGMVGVKLPDDAQDPTDPFSDAEDADGTMEAGPTELPSSDEMGSIEYGSINEAATGHKIYSSSLRNDVLVEAELAIGTQFVGSVQKTDRGHYLFHVPAFYGTAYLNMKAYKESDSIKKNMASHKDARIFDEDSYPDFYVKRDLFYPMFTHEYNYYEKHQPDIDEEMLLDTLSDLSMENDVQQLSNVTVKGRRRGARAVDWNKPAYVVDAYQMYNNLTDYGLSFGKLDMRLFPVQVCRYLYGNMNRYRMFNVDGRMEGHTYYRNYSPFMSGSEVERASLHRANRTPQWYLQRLKLKRLQDIRVFSDYEPRNADSTMLEGVTTADATVDLKLIPDDGKQVTFRDRHILFQGFNAPERFYQPDYSTRQPAEPTDYRRTLYWNPNAVTDENGVFVAKFYNNSKSTRIKMTAAGVTRDGRLMHD